jgi:hypothetical protein
MPEGKFEMIAIQGVDVNIFEYCVGLREVADGRHRPSGWRHGSAQSAGLLEVAPGLIVASELPEHGPQSLVGLDQIRSQAQRLAVLDDGFFEIAPIQSQLSK